MNRVALTIALRNALELALESPAWRNPEGMRDARDIIKDGFQYSGEHVTRAGVLAALTALIENAADEDLAWMVKELGEVQP